MQIYRAVPGTVVVLYYNTLRAIRMHTGSIVESWHPVLHYLYQVCIHSWELW